MSILQIINQIAADPSRNAKEVILTANKDNETLKNVFFFTYNPTINYFIKKIPDYTTYAWKLNENASSLTWAIGELLTISQRHVTGQAAIDKLIVILSSVSRDDAEIVSRIIQRDLKCGATDSTANKIWKGLIPEFPYMRCSLPKDTKLEKWDWKNGIYSQLKADAMYANCDVYIDGNVIFTSRNGTVIPTTFMQDLVIDVIETLPKDVRVCGEMQVERNGKILPREIGNGIMNSVAKGGNFGPNERPVFVVWDIIPLDQAVPGGKVNISYDDRFRQLCSYLASTFAARTASIEIIPTKIVYSLDEAYEHYFELVEQGYEGTIIKTRSGIWSDNTSRDQIKLKVECDVDLIIVGKTEGNGKNAATFGSITCRSSCGKLEVNVSGFTDKRRKELHDMGDEILEKIMCVRFNNIMPPTGNNIIYSLFLPRHIEIREDKDTADTFERIVEQFEQAIGKKK